MPPSWTLASMNPLILSKLMTSHASEGQGSYVTISVTIKEDLTWNVVIINKPLSSTTCPLLREHLPSIATLSDVLQLISTIDATKLCLGNREEKYTSIWNYRTLTLHAWNIRYMMIVEYHHCCIHL